MDAVSAVIKTGVYSAAWSKEADEGFTLVEAAAGEDGSDPTKGSIKGNIIISGTDGESTETVTVAIEWEYEETNTP